MKRACFRFRGEREDSASKRAQYTPEMFAVETRKLQILTGEFNALLKWTLWGMQISLIFTVIFATCGAVWNEEGARKLHSAISAIGLGSVMRILYTKLASIYESSSENLSQWSRCREQRKWISRFVRSTPAIRALIGTYFYADKELVLTSLKIISENSVTVLVSRN